VSPEDLVAAYLRWLPHEPGLTAWDEATLGRRIALGKIRMRWAVSRCEVVQRAAVEIAEHILLGRLKLEDFVDLRGQTEVLQRFADLARFSHDRPRLSRMVRRIPFLERQWEEFTGEAKLAALQDTSLLPTLRQILRGRPDQDV